MPEPQCSPDIERASREAHAAGDFSALLGAEASAALAYWTLGHK
jgi:hypothetical protein